MSFTFIASLALKNISFQRPIMSYYIFYIPCSLTAQLGCPSCCPVCALSTAQVTVPHGCCPLSRTIAGTTTVLLTPVAATAEKKEVEAAAAEKAEVEAAMETEKEANAAAAEKEKKAAAG